MGTPSKAKEVLSLLWRYALSKPSLLLLLSYEMVAMLLYAITDGEIDVCIPCLWTTIFGVHCPGCGLTTASIDLLKLDFAGAWEANPLVFAVLPAIVFFAVSDFLKFRTKSISEAAVA